MKKRILNFIYLVISSILFAIAINTVIIPLNIIAGGLGGLGAIVEYATPINAASAIFIANLIIFGLSYTFISKNYALNSIIGGNIIYPLVIAFIPIGSVSDDLLLSTFFGGAITGIGLYFLSLSGGSVGGTAALGQILSKYTGLAYGSSVSICDGVIVLIGFFFFGLENTLYAIIFVVICTLVANFLERGAKQAFVFHIITTDKSKLESRITKEIARGVTIIDAKGGYNADDKNILICVVKFSDVKRIKDLIASCDDHAFYYITSASSTYGGFLVNVSQ